MPTIWNGLGITACVFGLLASSLAFVSHLPSPPHYPFSPSFLLFFFFFDSANACNFLVGDVPGGVAAIVTFLTVGSCMYLIIHRSIVRLPSPPKYP